MAGHTDCCRSCPAMPSTVVSRMPPGILSSSPMCLTRPSAGRGVRPGHRHLVIPAAVVHPRPAQSHSRPPRLHS
ncbi:hypothetical protein [Ornithinimicrobium kibberense]|uniref:hypothetical protein n=1 Tax=Ornithinimicrobium kibberense TaxID=282060 RepID=UPI00360B44C6